MYVASTDSTNTLMRQLIAEGMKPDYIYAGYQTAGRGQTGNGWESEANKNLLCTILLPPRENLFDLNVIVSVAVHRVVTQSVFCQRGGLYSVNDSALAIKWPNDIYWQDRKLAGILIENALIGNEVKYSIAGIGLNVNQTEWLGNAPNPISLKQISGSEYNIDELMDRLFEEVQKALEEDVWEYYKAHLYRKEGFWPFVEREVNIVPTMNASAMEQGIFMARIENVLSTGEILLRDQQGQQRKYHFKQVRYVI